MEAVRGTASASQAAHAADDLRVDEVVAGHGNHPVGAPDTPAARRVRSLTASPISLHS